MLTELKTRGLEDILSTCVDGLKGFPEAIQAVYPHKKGLVMNKERKEGVVITSVLRK